MVAGGRVRPDQGLAQGSISSRPPGASWSLSSLWFTPSGAPETGSPSDGVAVIRPRRGLRCRSQLLVPRGFGPSRSAGLHASSPSLPPSNLFRPRNLKIT